MSQQVYASRGRKVKKEGRGGRGGRGYGGGGYRGRTPFLSNAFKSPIVEIASDPFTRARANSLPNSPNLEKHCQLHPSQRWKGSIPGSTYDQDGGATNDRSTPLSQRTTQMLLTLPSSDWR